MDIQLFENFALSPDSRMDIEIHENFALPPNEEVNPNTSSAKRAGDPALVDERPAKMSKSDRTEGVTEGQPLLKRARLSKSALDKGVKILVDHYKLDKGQEEILRLRAKEHKFVPTIDQVEWVVKEAKLREDNSKHKLNLVMFAYMEYYPWYLRSLGSDHRVLIGVIDTYESRDELWMSFDGKKSQLHFDSPKPGRSKDVLRMKPVFRQYVKWLASFDHLFQLGLMKPEPYNDHAKAKIHADRHDAYIEAATKVLARFPGLILERHPDPDKPMHRIKLHGPKWSAFPFKDNEPMLPDNPLEQLFKKLCSKKVKGAKSLEEGRANTANSGEVDGDEEDEVEDEDEDDDDDELEEEDEAK
ncbi:hypothetical protein KCU98_g1667, partial [Aureobasidium melanogenum]